MYHQTTDSELFNEDVSSAADMFFAIRRDTDHERQLDKNLV
jgi:hypothetical protein